MGDSVISSFRDEYAFLSNMFPCTIIYQGNMYTNVEAGFQAQKNPSKAKEFSLLEGKEAKRKGRTVRLRPDWENVKVGIMEDLVLAKFTQNQQLKEALLKTGNLKLVEGNKWNDRFWGVCKGIGENKLGLILMKIRQQIRKKEELNMANKVEETAVTNQVKEASKDFSALMEKAHADGKAVWQMTSEDRSHLRAPVLVYKDKEGNDKSFYPPVANMLPAVQHQLEIGSKDPRWIPAKEAGANPDIAIRKGAKAVTFVLFTKDKEPYTKKFFNMADLSGKGVPALSPSPDLRRDVYLHDMIDYLARRAERGTFKDSNYFMMFMDAKEAANKSYQAKKEVYDFSNLDYETYMKARLEAHRRLDAILKADIQTPVPEKDYEKTFIQLLAKEVRQPSKTTNYVIRAARKALNELKWQESHVKAAIKSFVPEAAFDSLARNGKAPSNTLLIVAVKGIEPQKKQEQAAVR